MAPVLPTEEMAGAAPVVAGAARIVLMDNGAGMTLLVADGVALETVEEIANDDVKDKAGMPYVVMEPEPCDCAGVAATDTAVDEEDEDAELEVVVLALDDPAGNMELKESGAATAVAAAVEVDAGLLMEGGAALSVVKKLAMAALGGGTLLVAAAQLVVSKQHDHQRNLANHNEMNACVIQTNMATTIVQ